MEFLESPASDFVTNTLGSTPPVVGSGINLGSQPGQGTRWQANNIDATSLAQSRTLNEYLQFSVSTRADFFSYFDSWTTFARGEVGNIAIDVSLDSSFASSVNVYDGALNSALSSTFPYIDVTPVLFGPSQTYYVRTYFYSAGVGAQSGAGSLVLDGFGMLISSCMDASDSTISPAAYHVSQPATVLQLGSIAGDLDDLSVGTGNAAADLDNSTDTSDEDGVVVPMLIASTTADVVIPATDITGSGSGTLHAWIDFDGNGSFDADEYASVAFNNGATGNLTFSGYGGVTTASSSVFGRFRLTSDASISAATPGGVAENGEVEDYAITVLANEADLVTVKSLTSLSAQLSVGDTVTFSIVVTNNGPAPATNVTLTDQLPAGLTATANSGNVTTGTYTSGTGVWTIPSLASGANATLTIEGVVDAGQGGNSITNTTTAATSDVTDPTTAGDDLSETVTVLDASVEVVKSDAAPTVNLGASPTETDAGDTITFTYRVTNTGSVRLGRPGNGTTDPWITGDNLFFGPSGATTGAADATLTVTEVSQSDTSGSADANVLEPGESVIYTATYTIAQAAIDAGGVRNSATAEGNPVDAGGTDLPGVTSPTDTSDSVDDASAATPVETTGDGTGSDDPTSVTLTSTVSLDPSPIIPVLEDDLRQTVQTQSDLFSGLTDGARDRLARRSLDACVDDINDVVNDRPILFETDKAILRPESYEVIRDIAEFIEECAAGTIIIEGHTDSRASDAYNIDLSERRVASVIKALEDEGVINRELVGIGYGERRPIASNDTPEGMQQNRRVVFKAERTNDITGATGCSLNSGNRSCEDGVFTELSTGFTYSERSGFGTQAAINLAYQNENYSNPNVVNGWLFGGYVSSSDVTTDDVIGSIDGLGLFGGLYGVRILSNGLVVDHYVAGSAGRHEFDLDFDS